MIMSVHAQSPTKFDVTVVKNANPIPAGTLLADEKGYPLPSFFPSASNGQGITTQTGVVTCGSFTLVFGDVIQASGVGFDAGLGLGTIRQATACAVFQYIESRIDMGTATPIIYFDEYNSFYANVSDVGWGYASAYFPTYFASTGSPSYPGNIAPHQPNGGFLWQHILSQQYPFTTPNLPDGHIWVNFDPSLTFNDDYNLPSGTNSDLFSIVLHQATHLLGVESLLMLPNPNGILGPFSCFETHLSSPNGNLIPAPNFTAALTFND